VSDKPLSEQEARFVEALLVDPDRNGTKAAVLAGYAERSAHVTASRLLKRAKVRAAIAEREQAVQLVVQEQTGITVARLVQEVAHSALLDPKDFYDERGALLPLHTMPEHARRAIGQLETEARYIEGPGGDSEALIKVTTGKLRPNDKLRSIELIAKLLGFLRDKQEHEHKHEHRVVVLKWEGEGDAF
jgi:phage terminase small subunit